MDLYKNLKSIIAITLLLCFSSPLFAAPVYYSFEGTVNKIDPGSTVCCANPYHDQILEATRDRGFDIGTPVKYVIMVGDLVAQFGFPGHYLEYDKYYAELIEGNYLGGWPSTVNAMYSTTRIDPLTGELEPFYPNTTFFVGDKIEIGNGNTTNHLLEELVIGEKFEFSNVFNAGDWGNAPHFAGMSGELFLTAISDAFPINEPPVYLLMVLGFAGLFWVFQYRASHVFKSRKG